jgi:hypothetical protein
MIAFASFVIKAHDANTLDNINSPVLVAVLGRWHRLWHFPNHNFQDRTIWVDVLYCGDSLGCHVGDYANTQKCCQLCQQANPEDMQLTQYADGLRLGQSLVVK